MRGIWSDERKFQIWLEIETIACEAMARLGLIPKSDAAIIRKKGKFDIDEIAEIEKRTNHDVIAFLENVASYVGPAARWIHQGLTSSDILDTTLGVQMNESAKVLSDDLDELRKTIAKQARRYKKTPMIGRSHGIHAEPITFGLKLALMFDEFGRAQERLTQTRERIRVGKLSGAVGTHAYLDPRIEREVCQKVGLRPATISTQIVQRDRHAEFLTTLALIASSIDRWATEFRHLQRTEVLEVEEFFSEGQKGSSAMPHKRNPITGERLSGLARVVRGNSGVALENVALWHERDISHSSAERIILPDSCTLLDYMLATFTTVINGLEVDEQRMQANLNMTGGLVFSQRILLALIDKGVERQEAYKMVQRNAKKVWSMASNDQQGPAFLETLSNDVEVTEYLSRKELAELTSTDYYLKYIDTAFKRLGL